MCAERVLNGKQGTQCNGDAFDHLGAAAPQGRSARSRSRRAGHLGHRSRVWACSFEPSGGPSLSHLSDRSLAGPRVVQKVPWMCAGFVQLGAKSLTARIVRRRIDGRFVKQTLRRREDRSLEQTRPPAAPRRPTPTRCAGYETRTSPTRFGLCGSFRQSAIRVSRRPSATNACKATT